MSDGKEGVTKSDEDHEYKAAADQPFAAGCRAARPAARAAGDAAARAANHHLAGSLADIAVADTSGARASVQSGDVRGVAVKILLALDGSEYSAEALKAIAGRPWPEGTQVRVLRAVEPVVPPATEFW